MWGSVVVAGLFGLLALNDAHTSATVLGLTAALGALSALAAPSWIAVIPGLVSRPDLAGAMSLSSAGLSVAMAVGPAIAGFVIAAAGPEAVYFVNALLFLSAIVALRSWKPEQRAGLPAEHLLSAMRVGLQYFWYDPPLRVVIGKVVPFALASTTLMALLPALARFKLEAGPAVFGLLSGAGGIGAVGALLVMPRIRDRVQPDGIVLSSMVAQALVFGVLAATSDIVVAFAALVVAGAISLAFISTVMTALQVVLPAWIRGRGVAVYLLVLQGSFAIGAAIWGFVAEISSIDTAFISAAIALVVGAIAAIPLSLNKHMSRDTTTVRLIDPPTATSVHDDDGPIVVTAMWEIPPDNREDFIKPMESVRKALRRQGALNFTLSEDVAESGKILESFTMATWSEYQRLADRSIAADQETHEAMVLAAGSDPPVLVAHRVLDVKGVRRIG